MTPPTQKKYRVGQRADVTDAVIRANNKILAITNQRAIPIIDVFGLGNQLISVTGGLYIGVDKTLGTGTSFSGLIDDVNIHNRAVHH